MVDTDGRMKKIFTVPEIKPLDEYDFDRAKIRASVRWLLAKSYGSAENVPGELREPFYRDQYGQEHVKPSVSRLLLSPELYCRAHALLARAHGVSPPPAQGSLSDLLQLLVKKGLGADVTEEELSHAPINARAHLALIDALMSLVAKDTVGRVKMAAEAEQMGAGAPWENALLFWVNTLNQKLRASTEEEEAPKSTCTDLQSAQDVIRYRKDKVQSKLTPTFPLVSGVRDLSNGCAVAALLHFYCPSMVPLEDVCLKDTMSVADSLYNLQLIAEFCDSSLQCCCPLAVEDLLYAPSTLHVNIMSFVAELLDWFEVQKPAIIQPIQPVDLTGLLKDIAAKQCFFKDASCLLDSTSPVSGNSNSGSPSFIFKQPFVPISSPLSPENNTWTNKHISRPLSAVTFGIPFGLDSDVDVVMGNPIGSALHSVSSDSLSAAVATVVVVPAMVARANYSPPEDLSHLVSAPMAPRGRYAAGQEARERGGGGGKKGKLAEGGVGAGKPEPRLRPEGAPAAGFFLHNPETGSAPQLSSSAPCHPTTPTTARMTSFAERRDDRRRQGQGLETPPASTPSTPSRDHQPAPPATSPSPNLPDEAREELGARLEERRRTMEAQKRRVEALLARHRQRLGRRALLGLAGAGQRAGEAGEAGKAGEGSLEEQLKQDEEETQAKERVGQLTPTPPRLEKQVTFSLEGGTAVGEGERARGGGEGALEECSEVVRKLSEALRGLQRDMETLTRQQQELMGTGGPPAKSPRRRALHMPPCTPIKTPAGTPTRAWVMPAPSTPSSPSRLSHAALPLSSSCPAPRGGKPLPSSSSPSKRHPPALPQHQVPPRPSELKFPQLTRFLTAPHSVDTLPRLRRVSPSKCRVQTTSSFRIGRSPSPPPPPAPEENGGGSETGSSGTPTQFSLELEGEGPGEGPGEGLGGAPPRRPGSWGAGPPSECSCESETLSLLGARGGEGCGLMEVSLSSLGLPDGGSDEPTDEGQEFSSDSMSPESSGPRVEPHRPPGPPGSAGPPALSKLGPPEALGPPGPPGPSGPPAPSKLGPPELLGPPGPPGSSGPSGPQAEQEARGALGFFFMEDMVSEEEMAQRRALLMERQQRRSEEVKRRRQWQDQMEIGPSSLEVRGASPFHMPPSPGPSPTPTPPSTPGRRDDFTRSEYAHRQQLRIMADLDKVLHRRPANQGPVRPRPRPHSATREKMPLSPHKAPKLTKVRSHSSLNLAAVVGEPTSGSSGSSGSSGTSGTNGSTKKPPGVPESPPRCMSPSRPANENGGKDCEASLNGTSPAPEYTGPKLFREPSLKSNKFIIHNALSRCCLAGKVNETQKNKIFEEMERSPANHFLILFRDASCQFRGVYTASPDGQELVRLTGLGPRSVGAALVEAMYKYSSDRKQFSAIPSKTLGMSVDAFTIPGHLWHGGGGAGGSSRRASINKKAVLSK